MKLYLVPKIGVGNDTLFNKKISNEILVCEERKLKNDITIETTIYSNNDSKTSYKHYSKNEKMIYINNYILDSKKMLKEIILYLKISLMQ
jgi:hypothetical protein